MLWRFSFASSSNVDVLLSRDVPPSVEELMDDVDILNECKAQNNKLVSYLSKDDSVKSLLQWVVAGLDDLDHQAALAGNASFDHAVASPLFPSYRPFPSTAPFGSGREVPAPGPNSPPLEPARQEAEDHEVPSGELDSQDPSRGIGLGEGLESQQNGDSESDSSRYPQIATEILTSELWTISETIMSNKDTLLRPFWDAVLPPIEAPDSNSRQSMSRFEESERERARDEFWSDKDEERDRKREMVRGMWTRVNCSLMMKRTHEMVRFIQSVPNVVDRIMAHIDSPAIQDMLVKIVSAEEAGVTGVVSWLADEGLVPRLLDLLSPTHSTNMHSIASELLKAIITLCAPAPFNPAGGNTMGQPSGQKEQSAGARDNRMIRELVSSTSLKTMIGFMLDEIDLSDRDWPGLNGPNAPPSPADPFVVHPLPSIASAASSLSHICNILVEIIRRNNSDFSEPHLFHTLRQRLMILQGQESPGSGESHDAKVRHDMEEALQELSAKMGIVHLGDLIELISARFGELHGLLQHPRSQLRAASEQTPQPLTLERSRLVELYAELLHSSNMSTMNRVTGKGPVYTSDGILSGGLEGLEALGEAIEGDREGDDNSDDGSVEDHVTKAKELPVSAGSTDCSMTSSEVNSDDEAMLENVDDITPSQSPTLAHQTPIPPPLSQADDERLRVVRDMDRPVTSTAASEMGSVSHAAVAATTVAPSLASEPAEAEAANSKSSPLSPGDRLKQMYIDHSVLPAVVDLFFEYPNNNFMHHVVYDILQQILNGRLGPGLNRQLVIELICRAKLVERILDAQRLNDEAVKRPRSPRLPFMGHVVLIADELVKFFARCPTDLQNIISSSFAQSEWDAFVESALRETKERDAASLAGGKPMAEAAAAAAEVKEAEEDTSSDEEEPKFGEPLTRTVAADGFANRGTFDADDDDDEFWTAQAAGRRQIDSSDDDDDDADWLRPSSMNIHGGSDDEDFGGFQGMSGGGDDVDDDGWGSFSSPSSDYGDNPFGDDNFAPSVTPGPSSTFARPQPLTPQDWKSEFEREFGDNPSPSIVVPNLGEDEGDGEEEHVGGFGESTRSGAWAFRGDEEGAEDLPPATSPRSEDVLQLGSPISVTAASVSALAVSPSDPTSPITIPTRAPEVQEVLSTSPGSNSRHSPGGVSLGDIARVSLSHSGQSQAHSPPDPALLEAATKEEPFGPGVSPDTHITLDGMLEKEVDGHMVVVPQDDIVRGVEDAIEHGQTPE